MASNTDPGQQNTGLQHGDIIRARSPYQVDRSKGREPGKPGYLRCDFCRRYADFDLSGEDPTWRAYYNLHMRAFERRSLWLGDSRVTNEHEGSGSEFFRFPREIRDHVYHELWSLDPFLDTLQFMPPPVEGEFYTPRPSIGCQDVISIGITYKCAKAESIRDEKYKHGDEGFFTSFDCVTRKFPSWLLASKTLMREGLSQLVRNSEWSAYLPRAVQLDARKFPAWCALGRAGHTQLHTLLTPLTARTVSFNNLALNRGRKSEELPCPCGWYLSTAYKLKWDIEQRRTADFFTGLSHCDVRELKLGVQVGDDLLDAGTSPSYECPYPHHSPSLRQGVIPPEIDFSLLPTSFERLSRVTVTTRFTLCSEEELTLQTLDPALKLEERQVVQEGMRRTVQAFWEDSFKERIHPVELLEIDGAEEGEILEALGFITYMVLETQELWKIKG